MPSSESSIATSASNQTVVTTTNASQDSTPMPPPSPRPASTDRNTISSSLSQPTITNIQQTPPAPNSADPAAAESPDIVQTVRSRKRTSSEVLAPRKQRRQELLDITNSNARREGTSKRVIKASARQQAATEGLQ